MQSPKFDEGIEFIFKGLKQYLIPKIDSAILDYVKKDIISKKELFEEAANASKPEDLFWLIYEKDKVTAAHQQRVAEISSRIAKFYNVDEGQSYFAGLAHDVGKVFIDGLHEKINPESANRIKFGHSIAGIVLCDYKKMFGKRLPQSVENAIKYHHMHGNGNSYPLNYEVNDAYSKIIQIADVIDAMKNRGIYQKKFSDDEVACILLSNGCSKEFVDKVLR